MSLFPAVSLTVYSGGSTLYALLLLIALATCWQEWPHISRTEKQMVVALWIFFLVAALSLIQTVDLHIGFQRIDKAFRIGSVGLLFLMFRRLGVDAIGLFLVGVFAAVASLAEQTWYEYFYQHKGFVSGLYYKIGFGDVAMEIAAILLAAALTLGWRGWRQWALLLGAAIALATCLLSEARGAWVFLLFLPLLLAGLYRHHLSRRLVLLSAGTLVTAVILIAAIRPVFIVRPIDAAVSNIEQFIHNPQPYSSVGARLNLWYNSVQIWRANPFFGTGIGDFKHDDQALIAEGVSMSNAVEKYDHAHNIYFDALATLGLVGLIVMVLSMFILPGRFFLHVWRQSQNGNARFHAMAGMFTLLAFAVFGLTEGWLSRNPMVNPYTIYFALFAAGASIHMAKPKHGT